MAPPQLFTSPSRPLLRWRRLCPSGPAVHRAIAELLGLLIAKGLVPAAFFVEPAWPARYLADPQAQALRKPDRTVYDGIGSRHIDGELAVLLLDLQDPGLGKVGVARESVE